MRERTSFKLAIVAGLLTLAGAVACTPTEPSPPSQINIDIHNDNQNNNGGGPTASPSPGAGGAVARVGIGKVSGGESCPPNVQPSGRGDAVKVGCTAWLTCSPYNAQNIELFNEPDIGTAPETFALVSGSEFATAGPHGTNQFNLDATGRAPGAASFSCRVRGVTSPPFVLQVVQ